MPSPEGAVVSILSPADGAKVTSPFTIRFGVSGMQVVPAGHVAPASGHHHLIIDRELPDLGKPVPLDRHHIHFGAGQTETEFEPGKGEHTLQLLFADHLHIPHDPPVISEPIRITVR